MHRAKKAAAKKKEESNPQMKAFLVDDFLKQVMSSEDDYWRGDVLEGEASKQGIQVDKWLIVQVAELLKQKDITMLLRKLVEITMTPFPERKEPSWDILLIDGGLITREEYTSLQEKLLGELLAGLTSDEIKTLYNECFVPLPKSSKME